MGSTGAILLAAGRSERMGGVDKLLQPLAGPPVIAHSIACLAAAPAIDHIVVVASAANREAISACVEELAPGANVTTGGERRRDSVAAGLAALPPGCDHVVIHDGARPLLTPDLIEAALDGARGTGAAICAVPVRDTVKQAGDDGFVRATLSREGLWLAQTPQAFRLDLLRRAHAATDSDATDDAALVEMLGEPVRLVRGSQQNLKLTTPEDFAMAAALLAARR